MEGEHATKSATRSALARRRPTPYYSESSRRRKLIIWNFLVIFSLILTYFFAESIASSNRPLLNYSTVEFGLPFKFVRNGEDPNGLLPKENSERQSDVTTRGHAPESNLEAGTNKKTKSARRDGNQKILGGEGTFSKELDEPVESLLKAIDMNERYLYYPRCGDWCKGISHHRWSLLCMLGEAIYLNRTLVLDMDFCVWDGHNDGNLRINPISMYYNVQGIKKNVRITPRLRFTRAWTAYNSFANNPLTVRKVDKNFSSSRLLNDPSIIVWRNLGGSLSNDYAFQVCATPENQKVIQRPFGSLWSYSPQLMSVLWSISQALNWDYDGVHIRRGDKLLNKRKWPNLDKDTRPESLLLKLPSKINVSRTVYISTDERTPGFFKPLSRLYKVYTIDDFAYLWQPGSKWYNQSLLVMNVSRDDPVQPEFDAYMQTMIDYRLFELAKVKIETFNDLTSDPRHGYH